MPKCLCIKVSVLPVPNRQNKLPRNYLSAIGVQSLYPCCGQTMRRDKNNRVTLHLALFHQGNILLISSTFYMFCITGICYVGASRIQNLNKAEFQLGSGRSGDFFPSVYRVEVMGYLVRLKLSYLILPASKSDHSCPIRPF